MIAVASQSSIKSPDSKRLVLSKNGRTPLKPKNQQEQHKEEPKLPNCWIDISSSKINNDIDFSNKENIPPPDFTGAKKAEMEVETLIDASLAEELSAIREKLERMRLDKENTEKLLHDRQIAMDMHMNQLLKRGQVQSLLEIEVDRLYRLNQIITSSSEVSPIRSLREKEHERKIKEDKSKDNIKAEDKDRGGELNSGSSSPLPHTPPQLHGARKNDEIKNLSSEFESESS
ncbi:high mobility group B protein 6 [Heracleum sosnowskyi]|uniref:High mobility group B protein 6 n=1 Tax=Heracleum sosnowskyi TaxID=360622 RepID=A0AAD8IVL6_9APIA|nr:high mobility group B protein 6 [Heracleum sosnowskyi]